MRKPSSGSTMSSVSRSSYNSLTLFMMHIEEAKPEFNPSFVEF